MITTIIKFVNITHCHLYIILWKEEGAIKGTNSEMGLLLIFI